MSEHDIAFEEAAQAAMMAHQLNLEREQMLEGALRHAKAAGIGVEDLRILCSETGFPFTKLED